MDQLCFWSVSAGVIFLMRAWFHSFFTLNFRPVPDGFVPTAESQWTEKEPIYLKIDKADNIYFDYITTWNNPDRTVTCNEIPGGKK